MSDPILDSLFAGDEMDEEVSTRGTVDPEYGKGRWANAILREVTVGKEGPMSKTLMLKLDLKGEEGMPFTVFADAPFKPEENGDHDKYEKHMKGYQMSLNKLKTLVHATGQWVEFNERGYPAKTTWPKGLTDFRDAEAFAKLQTVFEQLIGSKLPVKVSLRKYTKADGSEGTAKDCWGMDAHKV